MIDGLRELIAITCEHPIWSLVTIALVYLLVIDPVLTTINNLLVLAADLSGERKQK